MATSRLLQWAKETWVPPDCEYPAAVTETDGEVVVRVELGSQELGKFEKTKPWMRMPRTVVEYHLVDVEETELDG
jgi:hypothetical protein